MYREFDEYITEFLSDDFCLDFWYDVAVVKASKMLEGFNQRDWDVLFQELKNKSLQWKKRVAYCIEYSENGLKALLRIAETEDDELLQICIDSIRTMITSNNKEIILSNEILMKHINRLKSSSSDITKKVYQDIIGKLNS